MKKTSIAQQSKLFWATWPFFPSSDTENGMEVQTDSSVNIHIQSLDSSLRLPAG